MRGDKELACLSDIQNSIFAINPFNSKSFRDATDEEFEKLMTNAREKHITVLVDEAYHYFYGKTFISLIKKYSNVAILRTFSKLYSFIWWKYRKFRIINGRSINIYLI